MEQPWVASEDGEWEHEPAWLDESYWEEEQNASYEDWEEPHADRARRMSPTRRPSTKSPSPGSGRKARQTSSRPTSPRRRQRASR